MAIRFHYLVKNMYSLKWTYSPLMLVFYLLIIMAFRHIHNYIFLYSRPPIDLSQVTVHLGCTWVNKVLRIMSFCKKTWNQTTNSRHGHMPHTIKTPHATSLESEVFLYTTLFQSFFNFLSLNYLALIWPRNVELTYRLANTLPLSEIPSYINYDASVWIYLAKGLHDTLKQDRLPILTDFWLNASSTTLTLPQWH